MKLEYLKHRSRKQDSAPQSTLQSTRIAHRHREVEDSEASKKPKLPPNTFYARRADGVDTFRSFQFYIDKDRIARAVTISPPAQLVYKKIISDSMDIVKYYSLLDKPPISFADRGISFVRDGAKFELKLVRKSKAAIEEERGRKEATTTRKKTVDAPQTSCHVEFVCWVIKNKNADCMTLGRDLMLVFIRLGKIAQIEEVWKDIQANPASYGIASVEDYWGKTHYLQHVRISIELERKIMWMIHNGNKNLLTYYMWFSNKYFRGIDGPALRMECVRHILYLTLDPAKTPPTAYENRVQLLHLIVSTAPSGPDLQILKLCLFADWFGCDEKNSSNFTYVELPFNVIRYALFLPSANHPPTSIVQNSHGASFANSLLDFPCKSVDNVFTSNPDYIRRNVNNAMRYCKERLQHVLSQVLENTKIERKISDSLRTIFPDFMRSSNGALARPKKKPVDGPPTPTKTLQKNPLASPTTSDACDKPPTSSAAPSSSSSAYKEIAKMSSRSAMFRQPASNCRCSANVVPCPQSAPPLSHLWNLVECRPVFTTHHHPESAPSMTIFTNKSFSPRTAESSR